MSEDLTRSQQIFAGTFARETGLDAHVVGAWLKAEQSGEAAENYEHQGYNNWLNIARTDSGDASGAHSGVWANPESAAKASAEWIKGKGAIAHEYGTPAAGVQGILHTAGRNPQEQIKAIAGSGWASSGYEGGNTLRKIYSELSGRQLSLMSATQRAAGLASGAAPVVPEESTSKPNPIDAITALHGTQSAGQAKNWNLIKGLFDDSTPINSAPTGAAPELLLPGEQNDASRVLRYATSHIGKFAESEGKNLGPELNKLEQQFGMTGEPWCAIFATTAIAQGGASQAARTASVAEINQWASEGTHGYQKGLKSSHTARPGDLLTFGDNHVALVKEVKGNQIVTIEGNADGSGGVVQLQHLVGEGQIARPLYQGGR